MWDFVKHSYKVLYNTKGIVNKISLEICLFKCDFDDEAEFTAPQTSLSEVTRKLYEERYTYICLMICSCQ